VKYRIVEKWLEQATVVDIPDDAIGVRSSSQYRPGGGNVYAVTYLVPVEPTEEKK
jgi:hypothetical protein